MINYKIVLLPGLDGTGLLFKPFLEILPDDLEAIVITYPTAECLNYEQLVDWVITQLPDEGYILVAESFSGHIAYLTGLRNPKHLKSVVFIATFLTNPRPYLLSLSKVLPLNLLLKLSIPNFLIKRFLLGSSINDKTIKLLKQAIKQVDTKVLASRLRLITQIKTPNQVCHIQSIYIQASNDKLIRNNSIDTFKEVFSNLKTFNIKGPHFLMQSNPVECLAIIINSTSD